MINTQIKLSDNIYCICKSNWQSVSEDWKTFFKLNTFDQTIGILEDCNIPNIQFIYTTFYENNQIIGIAYFQLLNFGTRHYQLSNQNRFINWIAKKALSCMSIKIFILGNLFENDFMPFYFISHISKKNASKYINDVLNSLSNLYNTRGALLLYSKGYETIFRKFGFNHAIPDIGMEMQIDKNWSTLNDYLNQISRKYRSRAQKILKSRSEIKIAPINLTFLLEHGNTIEKLYYNILEKQPIQLSKVNLAYFIENMKKWPGIFSMEGFFINDKLVAFASYRNHDTEIECHYIGIDYEYNQKYNLYFNMLFYALEMAILNKKNKINFGRTALDAKASIGAKAINSSFIFKYNNPIIGYLVKILNNRFNQKIDETWKTRNPFK
jgi:hypothetical protein